MTSAVTRRLATWPSRIGALVGTALIGWIVATYAPPLFQRASDKVGLAASPIRVDVVSNPDIINRSDLTGAAEFVVPAPVGKLTPPPSGDHADGRWAWAHAQGGTDATTSVLRLVLRGRDRPVVINDMRIEVVARTRPLRGTLVSYLGLGSSTAPRTFYVDLDKTPPSVEHTNKNRNDNTFFPYQVSANDIEVFDVDAGTAFYDVRWKIALDYTSDQGSGTKTIGPFQTTARADKETWASKDIVGKPPSWWGVGPAPQTFTYWAGRWRL